MRNQFVTLLLTLCIISYAQESQMNIKYGSNKEAGKYATIDGLKIYYEIYGEGTPVLLLHGGLGSIENFTMIIPELSQKYKVIVADSPGHGRSSITDTLSYQMMAEKFTKFIDYLKIDSLYSIGWSDGGIIGFMLAGERNDKVKKLVAIGSNSKYNGLSPQTLGWMKEYMIDWMKKDTVWIKSYKALSPEPDQMENFLLKSQKMWLAEKEFPEIDLEKITIPTMLMQADRDVITVDHFNEMFTTIPNAQMCIIPNTTHFCLWERPKLISQIIMEFLK